MGGGVNDYWGDIGGLVRTFLDNYWFFWGFVFLGCHSFGVFKTYYWVCYNHIMPSAFGMFNMILSGYNKGIHSGLG